MIKVSSNGRVSYQPKIDCKSRRKWIQSQSSPPLMSRETSFARELQATTERTGSILCSGYDPAPERFPIDGISGYDSRLPDPTTDYDGEAVRSRIVSYFEEYATSLRDSDVTVGAFKPNIGYFRMYDDTRSYHGTEALHDVLETMAATADVPVILDVKDADIARSSAAAAISELKLEHVDAITVHPEMGTDSVEPFFEFAHERGQGVYVLTRTTNPGAADFQELVVGSGSTGDGRKLYMKFAEKVAEWSRKYPGTVGSVAAGNNPAELERIARFYADEGTDVPLLIPGVGTQGGAARDVVEALVEADYDPGLARINSSSGIMYRAQKDGRPPDDHATASVEHVATLNREIGFGDG